MQSFFSLSVFLIFTSALLGGCNAAPQNTGVNSEVSPALETTATQQTVSAEEAEPPHPPEVSVVVEKKAPTTPSAELQPQAIYPGVVIDRGRGHVDLRGRVVGRQVDWLELLACRPGTREHEAIVTLDAEATHIQLALILLGLEPGTPARRVQNDDGEFIIQPPQGPAVELFFVLEDQPGAEVPANQWVVDQETGAEMPDNRWLFVGSRNIDHAGQTWFLAEENGTLISLVNFGDELIGRPTLQSDDGGNVFWTANTAQIPTEGTRITLRIRPADDQGQE